MNIEFSENSHGLFQQEQPAFMSLSRVEACETVLEVIALVVKLFRCHRGNSEYRTSALETLARLAPLKQARTPCKPLLLYNLDVVLFL